MNAKTPTPTPAILGTGYAVPPAIRTNSDPVFDWLRAHPTTANPFQGYNQRRVLGPGETVTSLMATACGQALVDAGTDPGSIDILLGYGSVSQYITPNVLAQVHAELGLAPATAVVPVADEFTNFNSSLIIADSLIRTGRASRALIVCGCNWTQYVDYHTPQSVSIGDGAGAAVVGLTTDPAAFRVVDQEHLVASQEYGAMTVMPDAVVVGRPETTYYTSPYIHITASGMTDVVTFGGQHAAATVTALLERNQVAPADVSLVPHQSSSVLLNAWTTEIGPVQMLDTLQLYGNITLAAIPLGLAVAVENKEIANDHVVLLGLGTQLHASAVLLSRG